MWFVAGIAVLIVVVAVKWKNFQTAKGPDAPALTRFLAKALVITLFISFVLTFLSDAVVIIPAGHRAVVFDQIKGVRPVALKEGLNFIMPFVQEAHIMDVRVQKLEFDATAASKDLQIIHTKIAVNVHPIEESVPQLFREVGLDYGAKVIHPAMQEALKASSAKYTAEELITKRDSIKLDIHTHLQNVLTRSKIILVETYITDFDFSSEFSKAIELKQVAEQQALKAKRDLERIKVEAEQQIATARAQAESLRMQREAVTTNLIELRRVEVQKLAIEKWNGQLPQTMMGGATPFVDVSRFTAKP